ncbi:MAG: primosomal protein N', partial [Desulfuromonadales bacterium]|nr:primosomal protein N' [Desulfuromonadales bacterium]
FPPAMIPFFRWAADYYRHPLGEVIRTALPAGLCGDQERVGILTEGSYAPTGETGEPAGRRQREILAWLRAHGPAPATAIGRQFPAPHAPLQRLTELGFLQVTQVERRRDPFRDLEPDPDRPVVPSAEQAAALTTLEAALAAGRFAPFLLHGVTGSGKTEIYLRAIACALGHGRQALVLVPEIALTPQLVGRFRSRFAEGEAPIAVLHSGLSDGERYDAWRRIARGEVSIVIGARSAVFAPLTRLGVVVVDEEHESSYKQGEGFRYHARDLALVRAQMSEAVVLLGSATPALATFHRAQAGQTGYLPLAGRVLDRPLPAVQIVNLTSERPTGVLSAPLAAALQENLERGEQSLLLLNRRGFAPYLLCADCGLTFRCPNCVITLTFHQGERRLRCHYCDHAIPPPETCPRCQGATLQPEGAGTERLAEELAALLPAARIARMDRDTTVRKGTHQRLVTAMQQGEIDILVGTQMIAKGHDFPAVTLVGVVNADSTLNFPDFRSAERTFSLLTQVAGRAGRGERPGRVLVQTWSPEHYAIVHAARHDYSGFYAEEAEMRQQLAYPPFGHLVNLVLAGLDEVKTSRAAGTLAAALAERGAEVEVLGPAPCPLARLRGKSRFQVLLKAATRPPLRRLLPVLDDLRRQVPAGVTLLVDVDPVDML